MVDDQMQLKPIEPAHGGFAALGDASEGLVVMDATVMTDLQRRGIDEGNAVGGSKPAPAQEDQKRHHSATHEFDEATVADQPRKLRMQMRPDMLEVIVFEGPVARQMKVHHDRHHFAQAEAGRFDSPSGSVAQQESPPKARKGFTKIVYGAK